MALQVWFKNRRAKCRQQQKAAEQVSKTTVHVHHHHQQQQQRPDSAGSISNTSATGAAIHLPPVGGAAAATDGDAEAVTPAAAAAAASIDDVNDDRLVYRHHAGGLLVAASSTVRPSCGWMSPLLRQSSDTFAGPYRVGPRLYSAGPGCHTAAMFASRSGGYPGPPPYGSSGELGGYGSAGWNVSVTHETVYGHRAETCAQFPPEAIASSAVPLCVASPYDHAHHQHIEHYHHHQQQQQHELQLRDDELDDDDEEPGDYEAESSRRAALQSAADENKDWIKYQPL